MAHLEFLSDENLQQVQIRYITDRFNVAVKVPQFRPINENWVIIEDNTKFLTPFSGVFHVRFGKAGSKSWEAHSLVKEFDYTPAPPKPILLNTPATTGYVKEGGSARGTDTNLIVYCQNVCLSLEQAEAAGVAVVTASKYHKNGMWSYTTKEFAVAAGWEYKHISICNSDRIEYGKGIFGLLEYFNLPSHCAAGLPRFLETAGGMWWDALKKADAISAKLTQISETEESNDADAGDAGAVIEFRDGTNARLLLDGLCWDYIYNTLPEKVEVIEHRSGGFFTLHVLPGVAYEFVNGPRYNKFDESDCLFNRGYRRDSNNVYVKN